MIPSLTILIVTFNRRDILEKTLWYIYETSTDDERDIWIWDNASTDDTPDFLGTLVGWPGVRVFRSSIGQGTAEPRRRMLPHIRTRHVFTLDDDWWTLNCGWASGVSRVLDGDSTIGQVALGPDYDLHNDYGIVHTKLARPFFRVPPRLPGPKTELSLADAENIRVNGYGDTRTDGTVLACSGGEIVVVPASGTQLPFSCSGGAAAWRTVDVLPLIDRHTEAHSVVDLRELWSFPLQRERHLREAVIIGYGCLHPSPGPLWHLGHGESYWEERCNFAAAVYGRSAETQRAWLEATRKACGWGQALDNPDDVLQ